MTPSSTSSDKQQKKLVTKFERQPSEKTPPPAEPDKDCTGPVVMAIPTPKQGGSLIEHVVKTIKKVFQVTPVTISKTFKLVAA